MIQVKLMASQSRAAGLLTSLLETDFCDFSNFDYIILSVLGTLFLSARATTANNKSRAPFPLKLLFSTVLLCIMTLSWSVSRTKGFPYFSSRGLKTDSRLRSVAQLLLLLMRGMRKVSINTEGKCFMWSVRIKVNVKGRNVDNQSSLATQSDSHYRAVQ